MGVISERVNRYKDRTNPYKKLSQKYKTMTEQNEDDLPISRQIARLSFRIGTKLSKKDLKAEEISRLNSALLLLNQAQANSNSNPRDVNKLISVARRLIKFG
jgi:hypothetical protein